MIKETQLAISQYGDKFYFKTVKELREQIPGRCSKMYIDGKDGKTYHVGYVIGQLWLTIYIPYRKEVKL